MRTPLSVTLACRSRLGVGDGTARVTPGQVRPHRLGHVPVAVVGVGDPELVPDARDRVGNSGAGLGKDLALAVVRLVRLGRGARRWRLDPLRDDSPEPRTR